MTSSRVLVVRRRLERGAPYRPRLDPVAQHPEHLAEVSRDLGVGVDGHRPPELHQRFLVPAHAMEHPSQGVDDVVVVGPELDGPLDERVGFFVSVRPVGEGVSQRVEGFGVVRLALDDGAHVPLQDVQPIHLHGEHSARVEEVRVSRELLERRIVDLHRFLVARESSEQTRLGAVDANRVPGALAAHPVQMTPGRVHVATIRQQHADPDLRIQAVLSAPDASIGGDGVGVPLLRLRDPGEVVVRRVPSRLVVREPLELPLRLLEPARLHQQKRERVAGVVVLGLFRHQVLELRAGLLVASRVHQHAGMDHANRSRSRELLDEVFQHPQRTLGVVRALVQAGLENRCPCIGGFELARPIDRRSRLVDVPRPHQEPGERELGLGTVLVSAEKLPHHRNRGLRVLLGAENFGDAMISGTPRFGHHLPRYWRGARPPRRFPRPG